jgi:hypothetical protein
MPLLPLNGELLPEAAVEQISQFGRLMPRAAMWISLGLWTCSEPRRRE